MECFSIYASRRVLEHLTPEMPGVRGTKALQHLDGQEPTNRVPAAKAKECLAYGREQSSPSRSLGDQVVLERIGPELGNFGWLIPSRGGVELASRKSRMRW